MMMKKQNIWKWLFLLLLASNLLIICYLIFKVNQPLDSEGISLEDEARNTNIEFKLTTTKSEVNQLLETRVNASEIEITLDEYVSVTGKIPVFSKTVDFQTNFKPHVLLNGDLLLELESAKLGHFTLPKALVLATVNDFYQFPSWVYIDPKDESIVVSITKLKLNNGIRIQAEEFDLKHNRIRFRVLVAE